MNIQVRPNSQFAQQKSTSILTLFLLVLLAITLLPSRIGASTGSLLQSSTTSSAKKSAAELASINVQVAPGHYANGSVISLSNKEQRQMFSNIPYASRSRPFTLPRPITYEAASGRQIIINDGDSGSIVAPNQGTFSTADFISTLIPSNPVTPDPVSCTRLDIVRPHVAESSGWSGFGKLGSIFSFKSTPSTTSQSNANTTSSSSKRVVVYIHGGMMNSESRSSVVYRIDDALRDKNFGPDTIMVALEYSLGAFGLWYHKDAPTGEFSLDRFADQHVNNLMVHELIQAMLWIQRNIASFGGNPNDITVIGHSAGASLAHYLHLTLTEQMLTAYGFTAYPFHKLLLMGGTALLFESVNPEKAARHQDTILKTFAEQNDLPYDADIESKFLAAPHEQISAATVACKTHWTLVNDDIIITCPATGDITNSKGPTLSDEVIQQLEELPCGTARTIVQGNYNPNVKVLMTVTDSEAMLFCMFHSETVRKGDHKEVWTQFGQGHVAEELKDTYPEMPDPLHRASRIATDVFFNLPCHRTAYYYRMYGIQASVHRITLNNMDGNLTALVDDKISNIASRYFSGAGMLLSMYNAAAAATSSKSKVYSAEEYRSVLRGIADMIGSFAQSMGGSRGSSGTLGGTMEEESMKKASSAPVVPTTSSALNATTNSDNKAESIVSAAFRGVTSWISTPSLNEDTKTSKAVDNTRKSQSDSAIVQSAPSTSLSPKRLLEVFDADFRKSIVELIRIEFNNMGTIHGWEQAVLLNWRATFGNFFDFHVSELFSPATLANFLNPIYHFISTGEDSMPGLALPEEIPHVCGLVKNRRLIRNIIARDPNVEVPTVEGFIDMIVDFHLSRMEHEYGIVPTDDSTVTGGGGGVSLKTGSSYTTRALNSPIPHLYKRSSSHDVLAPLKFSPRTMLGTGGSGGKMSTGSLNPSPSNMTSDLSQKMMGPPPKAKKVGASVRKEGIASPITTSLSNVVDPEAQRLESKKRDFKVFEEDDEQVEIDNPDAMEEGLQDLDDQQQQQVNEEEDEDAFKKKRTKKDPEEK